MPGNINSINTNYGALVALQSLNKTTTQLADTQNRISSGLKVSSAKDNGAVFAIAEGQRARVSSLTSVQDGIDRAASTIDVALSAGGAIGDILKQLKSKSVAAQAGDLDQNQRNALQTDFAALRSQIDQIANTSTFNGANLANGSNLTGGAAQLNVLTSDISTAVPYTLSGAALTGSPTLSTTLATATGLTFAAGDAVQFTITSGSQTHTYTVATAGTDTIQQFLNNVVSSTAGEVSATYNATTKQISYSSAKAYAIKFVDSTGAGKNDTAMFDNGATTAGSTLAGGSAGTTSQLAVSGYDFRVGATSQALAGLTYSLDISTAAGGLAASTAIDAALISLNNNLSTLGSQSRALDTQKSFLSKLSDSITSGIGNLVDADMAKESAMLQSLQVKQQLGAQALSIANQSPSIILSFFK
ncbi:MAG: flagellin [Vitreimonas sp.]